MKHSDKDLYAFYDPKYKLIKIGFTKNDIEKRKKTLEKGLGYSLEVCAFFTGTGHFENHIHRKLKKYNKTHPVKIVGYNEWFKIKPEKITGLICEIIKERQKIEEELMKNTIY